MFFFFFLYECSPGIQSYTSVRLQVCLHRHRHLDAQGYLMPIQYAL